MYNEYKIGVWLFTVTPLFYINCLKRSNINYCASFICLNNSFCFSFKPVGNFTL